MSRLSKALAVLVLAAAYAFLKLNAAGDLPCEVPGGVPCPPKDHAIALVPASALLYAHVDLDRGSQQFDRAREIVERLPHGPALVRSAAAILGVPSGANIDFHRDLDPWLGGEAALVRVPVRQGVASVALIAARDARRALAFADRVGPGRARTSKIRHERLRTYGGGRAATLLGGFLVLGDAAAVREVIDVADPAPRVRFKVPPPPHPPLIASHAVNALRGSLPANRVADIYLSRDGVLRLLANRGGYAPQLDTFANYAATGGIAAAAIAHHDGIEVRLESPLEPKAAKRHPSAFGALAPFQPTLASKLSPNALVYFGVGKLGAGLGALLGQARLTSPGVAASLQRFGARLSAAAKLSIARRVLPLLGGEGAFVIEPTAAVPYVELVANGVDGAAAGQAIARLAPSLAQAAGRRVKDVAANITQRKVAGVATTTTRLSPSVNLTFATFDRLLVLATDPAGVVAARGRSHLDGNSEYARVRRHVPGPLSALVFLNLQELLGVLERAGLASNPAYATFRDDIHHLRALGVGVSGEKNRLRTRLFLSVN